MYAKKYFYLGFCVSLWLFIFMSEGYSMSVDATDSISKYSVNVDPLSACFATLYLNFEGPIKGAFKYIIEGTYVYPLLSGEGYHGGVSVRYYYQNDKFFGPILKAGKSEIPQKATREDPLDYRLNIEYCAFGAYWGKLYHWKRIHINFRIGAAYPIYFKKTWDNNLKSQYYKLLETTAALTPVLDSELSLRIPLKFLK